MDSGVSDSYDYLADADQFDNDFQDFDQFGWNTLLTSNQEVGAVEYNTMLGKEIWKGEFVREKEDVSLIVVSGSLGKWWIYALLVV